MTLLKQIQTFRIPFEKGVLSHFYFLNPKLMVGMNKWMNEWMNEWFYDLME